MHDEQQPSVTDTPSPSADEWRDRTSHGQTAWRATLAGGRHPLIVQIEQLRTERDDALAQVAHLERALDSNRRIGAAVGVLMTRRNLNYHQAFDLLRKDSQRAQRKVRDLADDVLYIGDLPR